MYGIKDQPVHKAITHLHDCLLWVMSFNACGCLVLLLPGMTRTAYRAIMIC
jgi:hypothetical protein